MTDPSKKELQGAQQTASRKDSHVDLALQSQIRETDPRFYYEPMLTAHPKENDTWETSFGNKTMKFPIWISSMTGGTDKTNEINKRLATTAGKYGLGMGVGSARIAIEDPSKEKDFDLRKFMGDDVPFYLNFGIAQIEKWLTEGSIDKLTGLRERLNADGFIIHVNPLQEWMQPEGDRLKNSPLITIQRFLQKTSSAPLIIKEVGQGFGPESMRALLMLPLMAIEFAAAGGTNFSKIELDRDEAKSKFMRSFVGVGQTAEEMITILNRLSEVLGTGKLCNNVIVSGGIRDFLDGYYFIQKSKVNAIYGQASGFLKYAMQSQEALDEYAYYQTQGLLLARTYLKIKDR